MSDPGQSWFSRPWAAAGGALVVGLVLVLLAAAAACAQDVAWRELAPGLELAEIASPPGLAAARIDPDRYELVLLSAKELGGGPRSIEAWAREFDLSAAINAGMYLEDQRTSAGYMKSPDAVNNPGVNPRYGAFFVFGPRQPGLPEVQIVDRYHHDWRELIQRYETVVQNFRMIGARGENTWRPGSDKHSIACVGTDEGGRVLFVHSRTAHSVHDFVETLKGLPLQVRDMMYVEGGPPASLYVASPEGGRSFVGADELLGAGLVTRKLPNVLGARPRRPDSGGR
jgi:uncharacterized protein YigE (DUF2233 family)